MSIVGVPSRMALLEAARKCIYSHRKLLKLGILHCDISPGNIMGNGMLIDFDRSVFLTGDGPSGVRNVGTRPFKAINVLLGEENSFMHDLESFFWVLFWICIYCENFTLKNIIVLRFEKWWYKDWQELAHEKQSIVRSEEDFIETAEENFTPYHKPLIPCLNKLREVVFPGGCARQGRDMSLYDSMMAVLDEGQKHPQVQEDDSI
ncbi:hypothetical protein F4781DRAFT_430153 [Annulohypoxylon bovei var. microspora]|nr:hypothetical protein F4781DRAFT_430153 [Annulohypoxylon bovei var. microspora]